MYLTEIQRQLQGQSKAISVSRLVPSRGPGYKPTVSFRYSTEDRLREVARKSGLSRAARNRLEWMLWYETHDGNARATCRHFGIAPKVFYTWRRRFDGKNLANLEDRSRRPKRVRASALTGEEEQRIVALRRQYMRYSKMKLQVLYREQYGTSVSAWKIQQVIKLHGLYPNPRRAEKIARKRRLAWKKKRITDLIKKPRPGFVVGVDTVVLWMNGNKRYVITAVDRFSRLAFARMYTTHSSLTAADFLRRLRLLVGEDLKNIQTDNGSEFHLHFEKAIKDLKLQHWWSRVKTPKDNAICERFNRTIQEEFIALGNAYSDPIVFNQKLTEWLIEYNFVRPHTALGYRRPIQIACPPDNALPMYSSHTNS